MFGIDFSSFMDGPVTVYMMLFAVGFLVVQGLFGLFGKAQINKQLNKRLQAREKATSVQHLMTELRRERALGADGEMSLSVRWFNKLVTRSGMAYEPAKWAALAGLSGVVIGSIIFWLSGAFKFSIFVGVVVVVLGPLWMLSRTGKKRTAKLSEQLPDGLGIIVRSLEAGHPVPTAIALVGAEMPDPIGSEFGMMADEVAYGASLKDSVHRLAMRSFSQDVDLFAATIRLQAQTGGNLSELLKLNGAAIRDRQMLRLKIRAASAEGRMSSRILTLAPFIVGGITTVMRPEFYGAVIHMPVVQYWLMGFGVWMFIGNMMMRKMIAFKI